MPPPAPLRKLLMELIAKRGVRKMASGQSVLRELLVAGKKTVGKGTAEPALEELTGQRLETILRGARQTARTQMAPAAPPSHGLPTEIRTQIKELRQLPQLPKGMPFDREKYGKALLKRSGQLDEAADRVGARHPRKYKLLARRFRERAVHYRALAKADIAGGPLPGPVTRPSPVKVPEGRTVKRVGAPLRREHSQVAWREMARTLKQMMSGPLAGEEYDTLARELPGLLRKVRAVPKNRPGQQFMRGAREQSRAGPELERQADELLAQAEGRRAVGRSKGALQPLARTQGWSDEEVEAARRAAYDLKTLGADPRPVEDIQQEFLQGGFEKTQMGSRLLGAIRGARAKVEGLGLGEALPEERLKEALRRLYPKSTGARSGQQRKATRDMWLRLMEQLTSGTRSRTGAMETIRNRAPLPDVP